MVVVVGFVIFLLTCFDFSVCLRPQQQFQPLRTQTTILAKKKAASDTFVDGKANTQATEINEARSEALSGVINSIERSFGKGSILRLGETPHMVVEKFSSGSITLDMALGGGYPKGRVIEIYGPESSGKTTLALHAIAEIQRLGGTAAFVDAEHALDPEYAQTLGVNIDSLYVSQPDSGEMGLDIVDQLVRSSAVDIVVVDSVAALVPRQELEGDMTDQQMGLQARLMSKALRKITGSLSKSQTTVIFINQLRSKIGVMFGNPEITSGGNALKFYSSVRVDIRRKEIHKDNTGITVRVKIVKNKVSPPFRSVDFDILFGSGIDTYGCLLDAAEVCRVVERKGSWYYKTAGQVRLAQGRAQASDLLRTNSDLYEELQAAVKSSMLESQASKAALKPAVGFEDEESEDILSLADDDMESLL